MVLDILYIHFSSTLTVGVIIGSKKYSRCIFVSLGMAYNFHFHTFHLFSFLFGDRLVGYKHSSLVATQCPKETVQSCVVAGPIRCKVHREMLNYSPHLLLSHSLAQ